jgi:trafficking protein particle complex subunit 6
LISEVLNYVERSTLPPPSTTTTGNKSNNNSSNTEAEIAYAKELAAAKTERMGYSVGFRLCECLSQNRTFSASGKDPSMVAAAAQLEAVKFLCKEVWMEVFRKQIDKLQTNHRGVFVLKDLELRWLTRLPPKHEQARAMAIQILAFPCGIIRGTLSNLGIPAVVSCDFLTDGHNMAGAAFNIKIK